MHRPWIVAPHSPLRQLDENLWALEGTLPDKPFLQRRMHLARLSSGALLFHNAVPMDEVTLEAIRSLGQPKFLIVPSLSHMLDAHPFRERFGLEVYCPRPIREQVQERVEVTGTYEDFPADLLLLFHSLEGVSTGEAVLEVRSPNLERAHLLVCDAVLNLAHFGGMAGLFMRLVGASGGPLVGPFFKWKAVQSKAALRSHLERLAGTTWLKTLVPSHGAIIDSSPQQALREAAARLY